MRRLFLFLLLACSASAQTAISIPTASGAGISFTMFARPGANIDSCAGYGNQQYCANLLNPFNTTFVSSVSALFSHATTCASTTSWTDYGDFAANFSQPPGFWNTAQVEVISGANLGYTGTVTASTATPVTFTLSPAMSTPCAANDYMVVRCPTVGATCSNVPVVGTFTADLTSGQATIANASSTAGMSNGTAIVCGGSLPTNTTAISYSGTTITLDEDATATITGATCTWNNLGYPITGTPSMETNDLSTDPGAAAQAIANTSAFSLGPLYIDGGIDGTTFLNMNGTYTLSYRAKAITGTATMTYSYAHGCATLISGTDTLTTTWQTFSHPFTASETGSQGPCAGQFQLSASAGAKLMQPGLTESVSGGNTTFMRNVTYQELQALHPGSLRWMEAQIYGCPFSNMIQPTQLMVQCNSSANSAMGGGPPSMSLNDYLYAMAVQGAVPFWTFSVFSTATEMQEISAYMSAPCSSGNAYATIRCNYLSGTAYAGMAWTDIFPSIWLEMGNEVWNGGNSDNLTYNSQAYAYILAQATMALRGATYYNAKMKIVGSGWAGYSVIPGAGSWNATVMADAQTYGGLPDAISGSGYNFAYLTDLTANIFQAQFAEPPNYSTVQTPGAFNTANTYTLENYAQTNFGIPGVIYEKNLSAQCGLSGIGITQATLNNYLASLGSGLALAESVIVDIRDAHIGLQNVWSNVEVSNKFSLASATTNSSCATDSGYGVPIFGINRSMGGPTNSTSIPRPAETMLAMVNNAIGANMYSLKTTQTGMPTYNFPGAEPDPTHSTLTNSIAANAAVPYVQAAAFGDGAGHYSLVVLCLESGTTCPITFTGAAAPTGTVTTSVLTSTNLTDNNESINLGGTPVVGQPTTGTLSSPTSDTLPAGSIKTYTWSTTATTPTGTQFSGVVKGAIGQ